MIRHRRLMLLLAIATMLTSVASVALAAASNLYFGADGEPIASMTFSPPPGGALPDFDHDGEKGLTVKKGGDGPTESDPARYQEWAYTFTEKTALSVANLTVWAGEEDLRGDKEVEFTAYVLECDGSCALLASSTKKLKEKAGWVEVTFGLGTPVRTYQPGMRLIVKIIVTDGSEDDMWFAYGTSAYDAHLKVTEQETTATTSTHGPSATTGVSGSTTTEQSGPPTTAATTTSTTIPSTTSTTNAAAISGGGGPGGPSGSDGNTSGVLGDDPIGHDLFSPGAFEEAPNLKPQVGLMVVYATVAENVNLYWQVALALGALMTVLLIAGFEEKESEADPSRRMQWHNRLSRI